MKMIVTMMVLLSAMLSIPASAEVYTRLEQVSNQNGLLVVDVQAMSDKGPVLISLYRGAFRISETLEQRVTNVSFDHLHFRSPAYFQEAAYNSPTRLVAWAYKFNKSAGIPYTAIDGNWTSILNVKIAYNQVYDKATLSWIGGPTYMVRDQNGVDISGSYLPIPADLQDIPLPVQLSLFVAQPLEKSVQVTWRTETELNNLGFNLYRSTNEYNGFERINEELIEGQGTTSSAHDYSYLDENPETTDNWYLIETISVEGLSTLEGPVQATVTGSAQTDVNPTDFSLITNYPNPFNPSTEIRYTLAAAASVEMTVYNIRGKMIKALVSSHLTPGTYSVVWDGLNNQGLQVDSGIYICEFKAGDQVLYHKMTMIK